MTSRTLCPGDVDGRSREHYHSSDVHVSNEPLLGSHDLRLNRSHSKMLTPEDIWVDKPRIESPLGLVFFFQLVMAWTNWIVRAVLGSGYAIGQFFLYPSSTTNGSPKKMILPPLTPLQEERFRNLKRRLQIPFDSSLVEHQDALRQLWKLAYPDRELPSLKTELWKEMGWQGKDPSTDFRGGGFSSLDIMNWLCTVAKRDGLIFLQQTSFQRLLHKKDGIRADWEYPFAVSGINISFMLVQMLDLQSEKPSSSAGIKFLALLEEEDAAFDKLYCVAFQLMEAQWLAKRASYMQFSEIVKSTRSELERELKLRGISTVKDLPAHDLLKV